MACTKPYLSDILFPPQIFLDFRPKRRQGIIEIHDDMNQCVEQSKEPDDRSHRVDLETEPGEYRHDGVVIQMQKGDLGVLLAQHEEDGVEQIHESSDEKPPADPQHPHRLRGAILTRWIAEVEKDASAVDRLKTLEKEPSVRHHHHDVVEQHRIPNGHWFPVFHHSWKDDSRDEDVNGHDGKNLPDSSVN